MLRGEGAWVAQNEAQNERERGEKTTSRNDTQK